MKAYAVDYIYNGFRYHAHVDAKDKDSARNKVGRKHGLKADESRKKIKIMNLTIVGFF